jgi:mRNA-degrading endonuclease toxin of MazEF toxin-antitoxin module
MRSARIGVGGVLAASLLIAVCGSDQGAQAAGRRPADVVSTATTTTATTTTATTTTATTTTATTTTATTTTATTTEAPKGSDAPTGSGAATENTLIVNHSKPFRNIDTLVAGDQVTFNTTTGRFVHTVVSQEIVVYLAHAPDQNA